MFSDNFYKLLAQILIKYSEENKDNGELTQDDAERTSESVDTAA